jgi:hypothetical protein
LRSALFCGPCSEPTLFFRPRLSMRILWAIAGQTTISSSTSRLVCEKPLLHSAGLSYRRQLVSDFLTPSSFGMWT